MAWRPVLIVDDDVDHAVIARTVLSMLEPSLKVETCLDPRVAQDRLLGAPPSPVVLIDRMLDGIESLPLVRAVVEERPDVYLVLLSSSLTPEDRVRALKSGARDAVEKPATLAAWKAMLRGVLQQAHQQAGGGNELCEGEHREGEQGARAG